jgi:large subunit ribosomal protein L14
MKALKAKITKAIPVNSIINCADNTGAKKLNVISVFGYRGKRRRRAAAGIGDMIKCSVRTGNVKWRKQVVNAVVVRQKKEFRRPNGMRVQFEDNAAIIVNPKGEPAGTQIKGPIAKEVIGRYLMVGKIANIVI